MGAVPPRVPVRLLLGGGRLHRECLGRHDVHREADRAEGGIRGGTLRADTRVGRRPRHRHLHLQDAASRRGSRVKFFTKKADLPPGKAERVPPGQYLTEKWPVLHYGPGPTFNPKTWDLRVFGKVKNELRWPWAEFQ